VTDLGLLGGLYLVWMCSCTAMHASLSKNASLPCRLTILSLNREWNDSSPCFDLKVDTLRMRCWCNTPITS